MKTIKRFCVAMILTLALTFSAFAGDILLPGATSSPPPRQSSVVYDADASGEIDADDNVVIQDLTELDPMTGITLSLLESLLLLF